LCHAVLPSGENLPTKPAEGKSPNVDETMREACRDEAPDQGHFNEQGLPWHHFPMKTLRLLATVLFVLAIAAPCISAQAAGPDRFVGSWIGELKAGAVTLRVVFNIASSNGVLSATMDSPDQGVKGIPVTRAEAKADSLQLEVKALTGLYAGTMGADGKSINGTWTQRGASFPLALKKLESALVLDRPQEPKPPFPYSSIDVTVTDAKAGIQLAGTLTIPAGKGPFPAVVLVTGSGPQDRNEELMGHKPFLVVADYLSRNGIAVLRYDDRGTAGSKGDFAAATTMDFADDAEAAFTFLAARREVDPKRVGIVGHSEGGIIAPIVASRNPAVSFIVLLAGPGLRGDRLLAAQGAAIARAGGSSEKDIQSGAELNGKLYAIAEKQGSSADLLAEAKAAFNAAIDGSSALTQKQKDDAKANADQIIGPLFTPWFRAFLLLDPAQYLSKVSVPVLALNGTKDLQVPVDVDLPAIEAALKAGGNASYKLVKLDGLNHLFQHAGTGLPDEYGKITETFAPEALAALRDWILAR
jgi:uncharacterized protein